MTKPITLKNITLGEGIPKICVPLSGSTKEELEKEAQAAAETKADLVEWRADFFEALLDNKKIQETLQSLSDILGRIPLIFTIRTAEEGGNCQIADKDYVNANLCAAQSGFADAVDVQVFWEKDTKRGLVKELQAAGVRVIASTHDFEKTDDRERLLARFLEMDATGADILKMAVMPKTFDDVAAVMQVTADMREKHTNKPLIAMAMGNLGSISRISGETFGSCITFGTVGKASAPGQFPIAELRMMMQALHEKNAK